MSSLSAFQAWCGQGGSWHGTSGQFGYIGSAQAAAVWAYAQYLSVQNIGYLNSLYALISMAYWSRDYIGFNSQSIGRPFFWQTMYAVIYEFMQSPMGTTNNMVPTGRWAQSWADPGLVQAVVLAGWGGWQKATSWFTNISSVTWDITKNSPFAASVTIVPTTSQLQVGSYLTQLFLDPSSQYFLNINALAAINFSPGGSNTGWNGSTIDPNGLPLPWGIIKSITSTTGQNGTPMMPVLGNWKTPTPYTSVLCGPDSSYCPAYSQCLGTGSACPNSTTCSSNQVPCNNSCVAVGQCNAPCLEQSNTPYWCAQLGQCVASASACTSAPPPPPHGGGGEGICPFGWLDCPQFGCLPVLSCPQPATCASDQIYCPGYGCWTGSVCPSCPTGQTPCATAPGGCIQSGTTCPPPPPPPNPNGPSIGVILAIGGGTIVVAAGAYFLIARS